MVGEAIRSVRDDVVIATKFGDVDGEGLWGRGLGRRMVQDAWT
jgi:aryl-alcohol dehydrogenase-like predicted oxidoreductase